MKLSVVVATLNARDSLAAALSALDDHAPDVEVIVVNGPSSDGTSGLARAHPAVDVLLELSERNLNAARNAGISASTGDHVAFVGQDSRIRESWLDGVRSGFDAGADVVTGPVHREVAGGVTTESLESATVAGRDVSFFDGGNVAFTRSTLDALDGFDEYLETGGARDAAHRLAALNRTVDWQPSMVVLREDHEDVADRVVAASDQSRWAVKYRALGYRLAKNYGIRPGIALVLAKQAGFDAWSAARDVVSGDALPSQWLSNGTAVVRGAADGLRDGTGARRADGTLRRNPNGVSSRMDRAVARYDATEPSA